MGITAPIFTASMECVEGRLPQINIICAVKSEVDCLTFEQQLDFGDSMPEHSRIIHKPELDMVIEALKGDGTYDVILLDLLLDAPDDVDALSVLRKLAPDLPIIAFSEVNDMDLAIDALGKGADDFLPREYINYPQLVARSVFTVIERRKEDLEKRLLQDQLIQAEKLDSLGRIAAGVAHEVKNPLSTVQMAMAYITTVVPDVDDPQFGEACELATGAITRAAEIISGMVDFSRNDSVSIEKGSLNEAVVKSVDLLRYEINKSKTSVHLNLDSYLPVSKFDLGKMEQILINLIRNSIQAMLQRDKVIHLSTFIVSSEKIHDSPWLQDLAATTQSPTLIALEIRDEGPGIGNQSPAALFEPFYTTKGIGEGTGLGLSVVMQIVSRHNGLIRVKNMRNPSGLRTRIYFGIPSDSTQIPSQENQTR